MKSIYRFVAPFKLLIKRLFNLSRGKYVYEVKTCDLCGNNVFKCIKSIVSPEWSSVRKYYSEHQEPNPFLNLPKEFNLMSCRKCGLVFVNPRIEDSAVNRFYEEHLSGKYKGYFQEYDPAFREKVFREYFDFIKKFLPKREGNDMYSLDVGCATGEFLKVTNEFGFKSMGIEVSPTAGRAAKRYGDVLIGDVLQELRRIPNYKFDLVSLVDSIEHFRSPRQVISLINKKMREGGIIFIETPNFRAGHDEMSLHFYLFSQDTIKRLLHLTGFDVLDLSEIDFRYYPDDPVRKKRFLRVVASKSR